MTIRELYSAIGGNYDSALRVLMMDKLVAKYTVKFADDPSAPRLLAAWDSGDAAGIFEGGHALKGVAANLGLDALSAKASAITEEYRPGNAPRLDRTGQEQLMDEIRALYEKTLDGIRVFAAEQ